MEYIDDYGACERTYATLCVYTQAMDPAAVTEWLGVQPSRWQRVGELPSVASVSRGRISRPATLNAWFLSSENHVTSRDVRRHIDWVLDQIAGKSEALFVLQERGCIMDVSCFWRSACGHGGPTISPAQSRKLAEFNLDLGFDIYGAD